MTLAELIYVFSMAGLQVRVHRPESAAINPWNIVVQHVSANISDTGSMMCSLDAGVVSVDSKGQAITDVIPVITEPTDPGPTLRFLRSKIQHVILGVTFTRNPLLHLPQQQIALLMVSFVRSVEQLMDNYHGA